jgi:hypothetical protein
MAFGSLRTSGKRLRLDHTFYLFFSDRRVSGPFGGLALARKLFEIAYRDRVDAVSILSCSASGTREVVIERKW